MYRPLTFQHPHSWVESSPRKRWHRKSRSWIYRPGDKEGLARWYRDYLTGTLVSHGLKLLNLSWELDDDSEAALVRDLRMHAIAAGKKVGVRFTPGRSTPNRDLSGELSMEWLWRTAGEAAKFAVEYWDPSKAKRIHDSAVRGGKSSHLLLTPADLLPFDGWSIAAQARELGCSTSHVSKLRRQRREALDAATGGAS